MLYYTNGTTYFTDELLTPLKGFYRFEAKKTLMIMFRQDGNFLCRPLKEAAGFPSFLDIPFHAINGISDCNEQMRAKFKAALSGITIPKGGLS